MRDLDTRAWAWALRNKQLGSSCHYAACGDLASGGCTEPEGCRLAGFDRHVIPHRLYLGAPLSLVVPALLPSYIITSDLLVEKPVEKSMLIFILLFSTTKLAQSKYFLN
jgi:hypothetical protein